MRQSDQMQIGKVGEYLACADLILKGLIAYPSEQGLPYDVVIDTGKKMLRCQVKTTQFPRRVPQRNKETEAYIFHVKRHGKNKQAIYTQREVDVFALVALDIRKVVYLINGDMPVTLNLRVDSMRGSYYDEKGLKTYQKVMKLREGETNKSEIARQVGVHVSMVRRILKPDYRPYVSSATYFSDIEKDGEWFHGI